MAVDLIGAGAAWSRFFRRIWSGAWSSYLRRILVPLWLRHEFQRRQTERLRRRNSFPRTPAWSCQLPLPAEVTFNPVDRPGMNVVGYLRGQLGLGESARRYARALLASGVPVSLFDVDVDIPHGRNDRSLEGCISQSLTHPITLVFVNPDYLDKALESIGTPREQLGYVVGCWFWELQRLPDSWLPALSKVDGIMVASGFIEQMVKSVSDKPVVRVPLPLEPFVDSGLSRKDFGLDPDAFVFLFTFDFSSWLARKNPLAVVTAFRDAFPTERADVQLVLKSTNGYRHQDWLQQVELAIACDRRIMLRDEIIERPHINALQRCIDAYVSLHRAEGFGMGMAECMAHGKPVIATGWSGNMEFMDAECAALVGFTLVPVSSGSYPESEGQHWAEPDIGDAARWMRRLADDPVYARALGERGRRRVRADLSAESVADRLRVFLSSVEKDIVDAKLSEGQRLIRPEMQ